jgi:uncharacterized membrane protein YkvA (DUF1232 family)
MASFSSITRCSGRSAGRGLRERLKAWADQLKVDVYALYLASKDPRVPWYAKLLVGLIVAYALSPIDLIPDFIPVLGYLDDLLIVPAGVALAAKFIPKGILDEHRASARRRLAEGGPRSRLGAVLVVAVWVVLALWLAFAARRILLRRHTPM